MIPIIENIINDCETKDALSEMGFLAGLIVVSYGIYTAVKNRKDQQLLHSGLTATTAGGVFMVVSYVAKNTDNNCKYRYQD